MKAICNEIRSLVIIKSLEGVQKADIATDLKISLASVKRIVADYMVSGSSDSELAFSGRPRILNEESNAYIQHLVDQNCDIYLDEIQICLYEDLDLEVSLSTIYRTLERINYTTKVTSKRAIEQDQEQREIFFIDMTNYDRAQLVFIDETGYNRHTLVRKRGRALQGLYYFMQVDAPMLPFPLYVVSNIPM